MLSALFSSFANFFETSYIVVKKTTGGFITFLFGAIVCVIAQVLLIPLFGLKLTPLELLGIVMVIVSVILLSKSEQA